MVEFKTSYYSPLDRGYNPHVEVGKEGEKLIQEPIMPIKEMGQTVVETDPRTGTHIIQNINAAIRAGAGNIQLVMTTPSTQPIGGRAKAYGKDVRQAIREVSQATGVVIEGVEMPTSSMTNLSGFDPQRGVISEQKRRQDMDEVRDAIKFVADVAGGGEVDIWSQEFPRTIFDQKWAKDEKGGQEFYMYPEEEDKAVKALIDSKTGRIIEEVRMNQEIFFPIYKRNEKGQYVDYEDNVVTREKRVPEFDIEKNTFKLEKKTIKDFKGEADEMNQEAADELGIPVDQLSENQKISLEEAFIRGSMQAQEQIARGWAAYHKGNMKNNLEELKRLKEEYEDYKELKEEILPKHRKEILAQALRTPYGEIIGRPEEIKYKHELIEREMNQLRQRIDSSKDMVTGQLREAESLKLRQKQISTPEKYAKEKTISSYAELGIAAMDETEQNPKVTKPIFVGPELGWPQAYGGHPDEFMEIVKKSREKMAEELTHKYNMSEDIAKKKAETHIKGLFDTSHLGMWLTNFRRKKGESEEDRLKNFNKWFMDKSEELAKSGTVGAIQAVDSASGAHGHLPPGQGIFPVVEAVKRFRELGYKGAVVSEGHEEERFGAGRILFETWNAFGSPLHVGYEPTGLPLRFPDIHEQYHRQMQPSAYFVRQDYAPDQKEWTLFTQTPLE